MACHRFVAFAAAAVWTRAHKHIRAVLFRGNLTGVLCMWQEDVVGCWHVLPTRHAALLQQWEPSAVLCFRSIVVRWRTPCVCLPHVAFRETGTFPLRCFYCIYGNLWSVAGMQIYIFIYFIGGVERITPFCCLTVKWVTVLYGGRKMYRIITVSCVDKAGQSWLYIDSLDNRGCHCIQNGTCIVWVCNVQRYKPGQDPYSMWSNYRGLQVLL